MKLRHPFLFGVLLALVFLACLTPGLLVVRASPPPDSPDNPATVFALSKRGDELEESSEKILNDTLFIPVPPLKISHSTRPGLIIESRAEPIVIHRGDRWVIIFRE